MPPKPYPRVFDYHGITDPKGMVEARLKFAKTWRENEHSALLPWFKVVEVLEAERTSDATGRILYRFPVQEEYRNPTNNLNGGMSAAMFDVTTSWLLVLVQKEELKWVGSSRSLNLTFLRPAPIGEMLLMETELVHVGKRMCLMRASLMREKDRAVVSTCEHQMVNVSAGTSKY